MRVSDVKVIVNEHEKKHVDVDNSWFIGLFENQINGFCVSVLLLLPPSPPPLIAADDVADPVYPIHQCHPKQMVQN